MVETEDRRRATTHAALRTNHGACGVESRRARGGARRGVVLVTEYEHEASRGRRVGGARAYGVERATDDDGGAVVRARQVGRYADDDASNAIGAVFEARWSAREGDWNRCAFADADGFLTLARAEDVEGSRESDGEDAGWRIEFQTLAKVHCGGGGLGMATCLDWRSDGALAASAADGSFRVMHEDASAIEIVDTVEGAHDLEMWAIAFDATRADVLYTGADDCAFKAWDLRDASRAQMVNRKTHCAGVTCVVPSPRDENTVVTGSYDDHVRLWDVRSMKSPVSELNVGGGAWRCRWHPTRNALACAAMGGGAVLVDVDDASGALKEVFTYDEHESIVYGADWVQLDGDDDSSDVLVTCSFYDKSVRCWHV